MDEINLKNVILPILGIGILKGNEGVAAAGQKKNLFINNCPTHKEAMRVAQDLEKSRKEISSLPI